MLSKSEGSKQNIPSTTQTSYNWAEKKKQTRYISQSTGHAAYHIHLGKVTITIFDGNVSRIIIFLWEQTGYY